MTADKAIEIVREFEDAGYWARMMKQHIEYSRIVNETLSSTAYMRHERSTAKLFKALVGRKPTREELDDILY